MDVFGGSSDGLSLTSALKTVAFYLMISVCVAQTLYPLLMIVNMWLRRANIFYHYFHKMPVTPSLPLDPFPLSYLLSDSLIFLQISSESELQIT
ncbi:unnamed protein product [Oppiella nova]|uniref:Uncharacterized protein n=1 Tax=Oppiella nova TaxID=334625 RepID=A0A7R9M4E2_9ACAR|nr:unnamed protein product [Oppiella nova]CAG2170319.1 unnamed protein product [Oppiella nova]